MKYMIDPESNWLGYMVVNDNDCPTTKSEVEKAVEGVFVRSRIEPAKNVSRVIDADDKPEEIIYLSVILNCLEQGKNKFVFSLSIYFSKWIGDEDGDFHIKFNGEYGTTGIGGRKYILDAVKDRTENALTHYIQVNFIDNKTPIKLTTKDLIKKITD